MVVVPPSILGHSGVEHQVQQILLGVGHAAEVVPEEKGGFAQADCESEPEANAFIRRAAVHDCEDRVALLNVPPVSLTHPVGPAGLGEIDLVIPREGFPDLERKVLQGPHQLRDEQPTLLLGKTVGTG